MSGKYIEQFSKQYEIGLIHKVYLIHLKNSRKYNAFTKTKSEVRGGGKKPWKQKGTGQARAGSSRSPLWVGGGVIFGPKPRIVFKKVNKKEKNKALNLALKMKEALTRFADFTLFEKKLTPLKTKFVSSFVAQYVSNHKKANILIILSKPNFLFWLAARNLKNIKITLASSLNLTQVLNAQKILVDFRCIGNNYSNIK